MLWIFDRVMLAPDCMMNRSMSQIPQCIRQISHNAPFCNKNVHMKSKEEYTQPQTNLCTSLSLTNNTYKCFWISQDLVGNQGSLLLTWSLIIIPAWISNHIYSKGDVITYPFPNFNDAIVDVWELKNNFIPPFILDVLTYPCRIKVNQWQKKIHVNSFSFVVAILLAGGPASVFLQGSLFRCAQPMRDDVTI